VKILQRAKRDSYKFVVLRTFMWSGKPTIPGDEIEISIQAEQDGMVQRGQVRPADLVDGLVYVALRSFCLPGKVTKFETKAMELIALKSSDALVLMLDRTVLPKDSDQWRPYAMKLGAPKRYNPIGLKK